jgi:hypothetical protein
MLKPESTHGIEMRLKRFPIYGSRIIPIGRPEPAFLLCHAKRQTFYRISNVLLPILAKLKN